MNETAKTITLKLLPGDTAWVMQDNRPVEVAVGMVSAHTERDGLYQSLKTVIRYHIDNLNRSFAPEHIHATKQELLDSL